MPTIRRIDTAPYPPDDPAPSSVLVRVQLGSHFGVASATPNLAVGETPEGIAALIRRVFAPGLVGQPLEQGRDIDARLQVLMPAKHLAKAAVDIALWDALAQSQHTSLGDLLKLTRPYIAQIRPKLDSPVFRVMHNGFSKAPPPNAIITTDTPSSLECLHTLLFAHHTGKFFVPESDLDIPDENGLIKRVTVEQMLKQLREDTLEKIDFTTPRPHWPGANFQEQLDQTANKRSGEFMRLVAHDIRSPLSIIQSYAGLMLGDYADHLNDEQRTQFVGIIRNQSMRTLRVLQQYRDYASIRANLLTQSNPSPCDLADLIDGALSSLSPEVKHDRTLSVSADPNIPAMDLDSNRIIQVLSAIFENAYQYTPAQGTIQVIAQRSTVLQEYVRISVADSGYGIAEEERPHIFEAQWRSERPVISDQSGQGLSLFIADHLIRLHRGQIWFESAGPNLGTTFYILLPIKSLPA